MDKVNFDELINNRVNQKTSSIQITRQAKDQEDALKAEFLKWAEKYHINYTDDGYRLFKHNDTEDVEIKESGEIVGMENAVKGLIERSPYLCSSKETITAKRTPKIIGG